MAEVWDSDSAMDVDEVGYCNLERLLAEFGDPEGGKGTEDMEWEATHVDSPLQGRSQVPSRGLEVPSRSGTELAYEAYCWGAKASPRKTNSAVVSEWDT